MAQNWTDDCFAAGHVAQTDLQNMENNFACIKSGFSGASAPSNPVAGMPWHDTSNNLYKVYYSGSWVTVYDLANDYAITARDCSRSVIAGTGMSGGGALTGNVTLNHASHTGDVSGSGALTIGSDAVNPTKTSHGSLVMGGDGSLYTTTQTSYSAATQMVYFAIKCPSGPTVLRLYARIYNTGSYNTYARLTVTGIGSATEGSKTTSGTTPEWIDCNTLDMSGATPGTVYSGYIDLRTASPGTAKLEGWNIWWE
jgi:hypothetical protein